MNALPIRGTLVAGRHPRDWPPRSAHGGQTEAGTEAGDGVDPVVANAVVIDGDPAVGLVLAQSGREVGEAVLGSPPRQPGDVVHRVTQMGEFPVDNRGDLPAGVHQVPWSRVTLHQYRIAVEGRQLALEQVELQPGEGVDRMGRVLGLKSLTDLGELSQLVGPDRLDRGKTGQIEGSDVGPMPGGEVNHEVHARPTPAPPGRLAGETT